MICRLHSHYVLKVKNYRSYIENKNYQSPNLNRNIHSSFKLHHQSHTKKINYHSNLNQYLDSKS